jgi:hypothetical protein
MVSFGGEDYGLYSGVFDVAPPGGWGVNYRDSTELNEIMAGGVGDAGEYFDVDSRVSFDALPRDIQEFIIDNFGGSLAMPPEPEEENE